MSNSSDLCVSVLNLLAARSSSTEDSYKRADRIFSVLSQAILAGDLSAGTKLPAEMLLAQHFRVSRPVIRAALKRLRDEALLESVRGSGSFVRAPPESDVAPSNMKENISHILHGVELRLVIEPQAAALAALRRTGDDLRRLAAAVDAFGNATALGEPTHAHDYGFHEAICRATANPRLLSVIRALEFDVRHAVKVWRNLARTTSDLRLQDAVDEHRRILECIRQQDAQGARRAMRSHIEKARIRMLSRS